MTEKRRRTAADYEAAADHYEAHPPTVDDIKSIEIGPGLLRAGRPPKTAASTGKTPAMAVRLPAEMRAELKARVDEDKEAGSESELIRTAVYEYLLRHPRGGVRATLTFSDVFFTDASKGIEVPGNLSASMAELVAKFADALQRQSVRHGGLDIAFPAGDDTVVVDGTIHLSELAADLTEAS